MKLFANAIKNMKIKSKLLFTIISVFFISFSIIIFLVIYTFKVGKGADITFGKAQIVESAKQNLRNYVSLAYETLKSNHHRSQNKALLIKEHGFWLKHIIDIAESIIRGKMSLVKNGTLTLEEAKKQAFDTIRKIKYDNGVGYVWINDTSKPYPKMLVNSINPRLEGKILDDSRYTVYHGIKQNLYQVIVEVCQRDGDGFVDYVWPKWTPIGLSKDQYKLSYVRLIKEWNIILGTGLYVNDATQMAKKRSMEIIKEMRYEKNSEGYFWINDTSKPYPKMVMHPVNPVLDGLILDDPIFNTAKGQGEKKQNLFQKVVEVVSQKGEGFLKFVWVEPSTEDLTTENKEVISFVKVFKPWKWIIGSNLHLQRIDEMIAERSQNLSLQINNLLLGVFTVAVAIMVVAIGMFWFFANTITKPASQVVRFLKEVSADGDMSKRLEILFNDEIGSICHHFNDLFDKLKQAKEANEKLEKELSRVMTTIHNSIINKLESIGNFIRHFLDSEMTSLERLVQAEKLVSHCSKESKNILFVLRNKSCTLKRLIDEFEFRAELHFNLRDIVYKIEKPSLSLNGDTSIIKPDIVQYILDVYTELLNNIIKHSFAEEVSITIEYCDDFLNIIVQDDGIGFDYKDAKRDSDSYGLGILQRITKEAEAMLAITSEPNKGTLAKLQIKIKRD